MEDLQSFNTYMGVMGDCECPVKAKISPLVDENYPLTSAEFIPVILS